MANEQSTAMNLNAQEGKVKINRSENKNSPISLPAKISHLSGKQYKTMTI